MCGIVGYIGEQNAKDIVLTGLSRLEYRGYDSAGLAISSNQQILVKKSAGRLNCLKNMLEQEPVFGVQAIGHTRWATHGAATNENAHPHCYGQVHLVHNGIIENYINLKTKLLAKGHNFISQTDTEIIAHVVQDLLDNGYRPLEAIKELGNILSGAYSLAIMLSLEKDKIFFIKKGSPLIVANEDSKESFLASDQVALVNFAKSYCDLADGDFGFISQAEIVVFNGEGKVEELDFKKINAELGHIEKNGHEHFMHKEIFEQPQVLGRVLAARVKDGALLEHGFNLNFARLKQIERIHIVACGSSYLAGMMAKAELEAGLQIPVDVEIASEYRYRLSLTNNKTLVLAISQSGETADTLAALDKALSHGAICLSICNVVGSAIPRLCEYSGGNFYLNAGPEISVASTKAFFAQAIALKLLSLMFKKVFCRLEPDSEQESVAELLALPQKIKEVLKLDEQIKKLAQSLINESRVLFMARGELLALAYEGALKMKELAYISAEAYPAGELKHGPIATIEEGTPVIAIGADDFLQTKLLSNISEVKARGAKVIVIAPTSASALENAADSFIGLPNSSAELTSILAIIPLQLLAYHLSALKGLDVDKPRNLAKSVTVE